MTEEQTKRYLAAIESIAASLKVLERPVADMAMVVAYPPMVFDPQDQTIKPVRAA